jgi:hypothetical protein
MLSFAAVAAGAKLAAWFLGLILTVIGAMAHSGRAAGLAAAERGRAAAKRGQNRGR